MRALSVAAVLLAIAAVGCGGSGGGGGGPVTGADVPPLGTVWFGTGFEAGTLKIQGRSTSIKQGSPIVVLGHFIVAKPPSEVHVQVRSGGSARARVPVPDGSPTDLMGVDLTAQNLTPGTYVINFIDKNRRSLAAGTLVVTP